MSDIIPAPPTAAPVQAEAPAPAEPKRTLLLPMRGYGDLTMVEEAIAAHEYSTMLLRLLKSVGSTVADTLIRSFGIPSETYTQFGPNYSQNVRILLIRSGYTCIIPETVRVNWFRIFMKAPDHVRLEAARYVQGNAPIHAVIEAIRRPASTVRATATPIPTRRSERPATPDLDALIPPTPPAVRPPVNLAEVPELISIERATVSARISEHVSGRRLYRRRGIRFPLRALIQYLDEVQRTDGGDDHIQQLTRRAFETTGTASFSYIFTNYISPRNVPDELMDAIRDGDCEDDVSADDNDADFTGLTVSGDGLPDLVRTIQSYIPGFRAPEQTDPPTTNATATQAADQTAAEPENGAIDIGAEPAEADADGDDAGDAEAF